MDFTHKKRVPHKKKHLLKHSLKHIIKKQNTFSAYETLVASAKISQINSFSSSDNCSVKPLSITDKVFETIGNKRKAVSLGVSS